MKNQSNNVRKGRFTSVSFLKSLMPKIDSSDVQLTTFSDYPTTPSSSWKGR